MEDGKRRLRVIDAERRRKEFEERINKEKENRIEENKEKGNRIEETEENSPGVPAASAGSEDVHLQGAREGHEGSSSSSCQGGMGFCVRR